MWFRTLLWWKNIQMSSDKLKCFSCTSSLLFPARVVSVSIHTVLATTKPLNSLVEIRRKRTERRNEMKEDPKLCKMLESANSLWSIGWRSMLSHCSTQNTDVNLVHAIWNEQFWCESVSVIYLSLFCIFMSADSRVKLIFYRSFDVLSFLDLHFFLFISFWCAHTQKKFIFDCSFYSKQFVFVFPCDCKDFDVPWFWHFFFFSSLQSEHFRQSFIETQIFGVS